MNNISTLNAGEWLARMAAADGVISPNELTLLKNFADRYEIDFDYLLGVANSQAGKNTKEVEIVDFAQQRGLQFEKFIVSLLNDKQRFSLISWRGDKKSGDVYAKDSLLPDLVIKHKLNSSQTVEYLVECKFRSSLPDGILDLSDQLGRYRRLTMRNYGHAELFLAIGIGGTPSHPKQLYIIPNRMVVRNYIINIHNFSKCLCSNTSQAFSSYINHYYERRVFKTL
jgi:hypothetical protein